MFSNGLRMGAVVLLTVATGACGSDPVGGDDDLLVQELYGSWDWVATEGGIAGLRRTPESEGFEQRVVLHDAFQIELFVDGQSVIATTFTFSSVDPDGDALSGMTFAEPLPGFETAFVGITDDGELILVDPCCDRFVHKFSRSGGS